MLRALALTAVLIAPAAATSAPWLPPTALAPPTRGSGPPAVAGNDDGRAVAAWATRDGVMASLRTPGGPWYSPARVPGSGRGATDVAVAMTDDGLAAVTWVERGRVRGSIRPARKRFLPSTWISPAGRLALGPRVAFGLGCGPLVAWQSEEQGGSAIRAACGRGDGRFGAQARVSPDGEQASTPAVAGGRTGVIVLWRQDEGGAYRVRSATRGPSGGFSPADTPSPSGTAVIVDPSVALAPDGAAVAAWTLTRGDSVVVQSAVRPVTGGWTTPDDLSRPAPQARGARVAVDGTGNAVAAWSRAGVVQVAERPTGQPWGAARDVSDSGVTAGGPSLAVSGGGSAVIAWPAVVGGAAVAQASLRPFGGAFTTGTTISDAGRPAIAPQATVSDDGIAPVAWQWTDPAQDPTYAPSGVMTATGVAGTDVAGAALVVDLRARPSRVRPGQPIRITFGLSHASRVRITARRDGSGRVDGAIEMNGVDGANLLVLSGSLGGASLGRGRWVITAQPAGGVARSLSLVVV